MQFLPKWTYKSDVTFDINFLASELECARQSQQKVSKTGFCSFTCLIENV